MLCQQYALRCVRAVPGLPGPLPGGLRRLAEEGTAGRAGVRGYSRTPVPSKMRRLTLNRAQEQQYRDAEKQRTATKLQQLQRKVKDLSKAGAAPPGKRGKKRDKQPYTKPAPRPLRPPFSIFVSCLPGLEPLLLREVTYLQSQWAPFSADTKHKAKAVPGGVKLVISTVAHIHALHLYLGTASHIYLRLNDDETLFRARGFPEYKKKLKDLIVSQQWQRFFALPARKNDGTMEERNLPWALRVHVTCSKSKLMHTKAVEERTRETLGAVLGVRGWEATGDARDAGDARSTRAKGGRERPVVRLLVRITRDVVQLSLDTSSSGSAIPLHMRGYRLNPFRAPLREDLAFALSVAGGVPLQWNLRPLQPLFPGDEPVASPAAASSVAKGPGRVRLLDPFCGSGTVAIESAALLAGLPPGRFRECSLAGTILYDPRLWDNMRSKALSVSFHSEDGAGGDGGADSNTPLVAANDISRHAIEAARANAQRAGVEQFVEFKTGSYRDHPLLRRAGPSESDAPEPEGDTAESEALLVVTNPPYGTRLSSSEDAYKKFARALSRASRDTCCTLIGKDPRSLRESSLKLNVVFSTKQGGLSVVVMTEAP